MEFPTGIQSFEKLRRSNCYYVDKTELVFRLTRRMSSFFLSRPRRFGKSLLLSTMRAYFEGKRELFEGLAISELESEWTEYPVLYVDLNGENYTKRGGLEQALDRRLREMEMVYGKARGKQTLAGRFEHVIRSAHRATGKMVVVLVDEYDKPLLDNFGNEELQQENRELLKGFYSNIKLLDECIRFAFLTGVSRFSKISIFSDLNNFTDISMLADYATICGITEGELLGVFEEPIKALAAKQKCSFSRACSELKRMYDGYHFAAGAEGVYNPYSLMLALSNKDMGRYWYATGTPTFLARAVRNDGINLESFAKEIIVPEASLLSTSDKKKSPALLYQSGYLTIKKRNSKNGMYTLVFPNEEVRVGFFDSLAESYFADEKGDNAFDVVAFLADLNAGNIESFMKRLETLFAIFDYRLIADAEVHFQSAVFLICTLIGLNSEVERCTCNGRMDYVLYTSKYIYIFEFKINESAEKALNQIEEKGYAKAFEMHRREVIKVGVNFSTEKKCIESYLVKRNN